AAGRAAAVDRRAASVGRGVPRIGGGSGRPSVAGVGGVRDPRRAGRAGNPLGAEGERRRQPRSRGDGDDGFSIRSAGDGAGCLRLELLATALRIAAGVDQVSALGARPSVATLPLKNKADYGLPFLFEIEQENGNLS